MGSDYLFPWEVNIPAFRIRFSASEYTCAAPPKAEGGCGYLPEWRISAIDQTGQQTKPAARLILLGEML